MGAIEYYQATEDDAALMADYRVQFLAELLGQQKDELVQELIQNLEQYFRAAINSSNYIGWLAKDGDEVVSVGGMAIRTQPGNFKNPSGRTGYIMNMYTVPAYRKRGICKNILDRLIETGKRMGISAFELHATKDGEPMYQKNGFIIHGEPTYRKYE